MTTDLDTRLHRAADSLHHAVESLPLEAAPRPSGRSPVVLGVVLLVVAATTTALVSSNRGGDDGIAVPTDTVADVQALVAAEVPEGFEVAWAGEQAAGAAADAAVDGDAAVGVDANGANGSGLVEGQAMGLYTYLYGATGSSVANPFSTSDLVVNVWDSSDLTGDAAAQATGALQSLDGLTGTAATTVRGVDALVCAPPSCTVDGVADVTTVWWHETDDLEVVLASRSLTVDQVVAIADGLSIDQEDVTLGALPAGLPGPLDEVGRLHDTAVAATRDAVAHWVGYIDTANPTGRYVDVTTLAGDEAELMALVWELGADQQISVRGTDAWLVVDDTTDVPQIDLVWQEASGVLVHVTSLGVGQDQVLDLVESLQAASDDEWADVKADVAAAQAAGTAAGAGAQVDTGAGASAGVGADTGAGDEGEGDAGVSASAGASGAGVDAQVDVDAGVADVEAGLHADLGTEAVIGAVQSTVDQTAAAAARAQAQVEADARAAAEDNPLIP